MSASRKLLIFISLCRIFPIVMIYWYTIFRSWSLQLLQTLYKSEEIQKSFHENDANDEASLLQISR